MTEDTDVPQLIHELGVISKRYTGSQDPAHDWYHTLRVKDNAMRIAAVEGGDTVVLEIATLLHDMGRLEAERSGESHAIISATMARQLLAGSEPILGKERIENIIHSIKAHSFRTGIVPETLEAKIVYDADKLDALGAIGIARVFAYAGRYSYRLHPGIWVKDSEQPDGVVTPVDEFNSKLKMLRDRMYTETGKRLAEERLEFMTMFFRRYWAEVVER